MVWLPPLHSIGDPEKAREICPPLELVDAEQPFSRNGGEKVGST